MKKMAISPQAYRNSDPGIYSGPQKEVAPGSPGYRRAEGGEEARRRRRRRKRRRRRRRRMA